MQWTPITFEVTRTLHTVGFVCTISDSASLKFLDGMYVLMSIDFCSCTVQQKVLCVYIFKYKKMAHKQDFCYVYSNKWEQENKVFIIAP